MPFNSNANNFNSSNSYKEESFHVLKNSYQIAEEGFNQLQPVEMQYRPTASIQQYILPASLHSSVEYRNQDELSYINHEQKERKAPVQRKAPAPPKTEEMTGTGLGKMVRKTSNTVKKGAKKTGNAVKRSAKDKDGLLHKAIETSLDYAIPIAAEALGAAASTYMTGDPTTGAIMGKAAGEYGRDKLHQKTGYGAKDGIGKYEKNIKLDKVIDKYVRTGGNAPKAGRQPAPKKGETYQEISDTKPYTPLPQVNKSPRPMPIGMKKRHEIVQQVMKEHKLSLPQASKFVKEKNLYKK
jgi:hypothetical protein